MFKDAKTSCKRFGISLSPKNVLRITLVIILSAIWIGASVMKMLSMEDLAESINGMLKVLYDVAFVIAIVVVALEALTGMLLLSGKLTRVGAYLSIWLAGMFLVVNWVRYSERIPAPCDCFGAIYKMNPLGMILIDAFIALTSLALLRLISGETYEFVESK